MVSKHRYTLSSFAIMVFLVWSCNSKIRTVIRNMTFDETKQEVKFSKDTLSQGIIGASRISRKKKRVITVFLVSYKSFLEKKDQLKKDTNFCDKRINGLKGGKIPDITKQIKNYTERLDSLQDSLSTWSKEKGDDERRFLFRQINLIQANILRQRQSIYMLNEQIIDLRKQKQKLKRYFAKEKEAIKQKFWRAKLTFRPCPSKTTDTNIIRGSDLK